MSTYWIDTHCHMNDSTYKDSLDNYMQRALDNDVRKSLFICMNREDLAYTFELKDDLYVNRETLRLSSTPKEGYVKTRHIYLPVNEMQNQSNYDCNFVMTDFGIDKDMIVHNFKLKALKNTFGDCSNSKYCIIRKSAL